MKKVFMAILLFSIIFTGIGCAGFKDKINNIMQNLNLAPKQGDSMITSTEPETADDEAAADAGDTTADTPAASSSDIIEIGYFDYKSWDLQDGMIKSWIRNNGADLIRQLKALPSDASIIIEGHTCKTGPEEYVSTVHPGNTEISKRRAEAIKEWLVSEGVSASQIEVVALGSTSLKNPAHPRLMENRRVVIKIRY